jgi:hypothetical protein
MIFFTINLIIFDEDIIPKNMSFVEI